MLFGIGNAEELRRQYSVVADRPGGSKTCTFMFHCVSSNPGSTSYASTKAGLERLTTLHSEVNSEKPQFDLQFFSQSYPQFLPPGYAPAEFDLQGLSRWPICKMSVGVSLRSRSVWVLPNRLDSTEPPQFQMNYLQTMRKSCFQLN